MQAITSALEADVHSDHDNYLNSKRNKKGGGPPFYLSLKAIISRSDLCELFTIL